MLRSGTPVAFPGPVLALDVGTAKVGVAITDAARRMAFPVSTLPRQSVARDAAALARIVRDRGVTALVVGIPEASDRIAHLARQLGQALAERTGLALHFVDEGYSSSEARLRIEATGQLRTTVDAHAAAIILETWLAAQAPPDSLPPAASPG